MLLVLNIGTIVLREQIILILLFLHYNETFKYFFKIIGVYILKYIISFCAFRFSLAICDCRLSAVGTRPPPTIATGLKVQARFSWSSCVACPPLPLPLPLGHTTLTWPLQRIPIWNRCKMTFCHDLCFHVALQVQQFLLY